MPRNNANELTILECLRCGYNWVSRKLDNKKPARCPKCKTVYWDKEYKRPQHATAVRKWHARRRVGNLPQKLQKTPP